MACDVAAAASEKVGGASLRDAGARGRVVGRDVRAEAWEVSRALGTHLSSVFIEIADFYSDRGGDL